MAAANGDGHPADPNRDRIAAERAEVHRLDGYAFVEAEVPQAAGFAVFEAGPIDRQHARPSPDRQLVKAGDICLERRVHCCD